MIGVGKSIDRNRRGMSIKHERTRNYPISVLLVSKEINPQFQTMVVVSKFKFGSHIRITSQVAIVIKKSPFNIQITTPVINIRIVVAKEIPLIFSVIKIDTVLRLRSYI